MYANSAAISRPEISAFLEEAREAERFYIAQTLFPVLGVVASAGRYPRLKIKNGGLLRKESTLRGPTGTYNEVTRKFEWDTYDCKDRGLEERIDDVQARQMADFFDMEVATGKLVTRSVALDYEVRCAERAFDDTVLVAEEATVDYTEVNLATIDFALDMQKVQERMTKFQQPWNTLVMSLQLFNRVRRTPLLQRYIFGEDIGNTKKLITPKMLQDAFMIDNVVIAQASYDQAPKGKDADIVPVWGSDFWGLYNIKGGDFSEGGLGRTLVWEADTPNGIFATETYRDEKRRGDMVRVRSNTDEKILDETAGVLLETSWA